MSNRKLETCLSPALYNTDDHSCDIVVVIDVLRASSAICTALDNGAEKLIPVKDVATAKDYKARGYLVAAERDGFVLDFADFGNSPFNFTTERVKGQTIVYSTTNGTGIIEMSSTANKTVIGCFLNISSLVEWIKKQNSGVLLFCAGWKNRFNLEDSVCAGAVAEKLMATGLYTTICDSTLAVLDLWSLAKKDLEGYIEKAAQRNRLREKGLDDCLSYCLSTDLTKTIPVISDGFLVGIDEDSVE